MTHKDTKGKIALNLVPPHAYEAIAKVRMFGKEKYGDPWGWKECCKSEDFIEAAKRHLNQIAKGEELDKESGLPHLHHALCSLAMAAELYEGECEDEEAFNKRMKEQGIDPKRLSEPTVKHELLLDE